MDEKCIVQVPLISEARLIGICSCVHQALREFKTDDKFFVLKVWFPDAAAVHLRQYCPPDEYHIRRCTEENYRNPSIIAHAKRIWENGYIPVEIIQIQGGIFFGINKINSQIKSLEYCEDL